MSTKKRRKPGPAADSRDVDRVIRELREDLRDARRLEVALGRHRLRTGSPRPYARLTQDASRLARELGGLIDFLGSEVSRRWGGEQVSEESVRGHARQRRGLHRVLAELPLPLFTGIALDAPLLEVTEDPGGGKRRAAPAGDLESALLRLPAPWLESVRRRHEIRGHRARARVAAGIADGVHRPRTFGEFLDGLLGPDHLRLLGRFVAAGRTPVAEMSPAEREDLAVPRVWTRTAPGVGGALRQVGLVFVSVGDGGVGVYVPEGARSPMALVLAPRVAALGSAPDEDLARTLSALAGPERDRRAREEESCQGLYEVPWALPTRLARLRRRTPGPDRVVEIEVRSDDEQRSVTRRILISYQRTLGALREVIQLALAQPVRRGRIFVPPDTGEPFRCWMDPTEGRFEAGVRDEWATSIRDALAVHRATLHYAAPRGMGVRCVLRLVRLHAPERVAREPRVVWGEGVHAEPPDRLDPAQLQASLDAANVFLERM